MTQEGFSFEMSQSNDFQLDSFFLGDQEPYLEFDDTLPIFTDFKELPSGNESKTTETSRVEPSIFDGIPSFVPLSKSDRDQETGARNRGSGSKAAAGKKPPEAALGRTSSVNYEEIAELIAKTIEKCWGGMNDQEFYKNEMKDFGKHHLGIINAMNVEIETRCENMRREFDQKMAEANVKIDQMKRLIRSTKSKPRRKPDNAIVKKQKSMYDFVQTKRQRRKQPSISQRPNKRSFSLDSGVTRQGDNTYINHYMWSVIIFLSMSTHPTLRIFIPCQVFPDRDIFKLSYDKQRFDSLLKFMAHHLDDKHNPNYETSFFYHLSKRFDRFVNVKKSQVGQIVLNRYLKGFERTTFTCARSNEDQVLLSNREFMFLTRCLYNTEGVKQRQHVRKSKNFEQSKTLTEVVERWGEWNTLDELCIRIFGVDTSHLYGKIQIWHRRFAHLKYNNTSATIKSDRTDSVEFDYMAHMTSWTNGLGEIIKKVTGKSMVVDHTTLIGLSDPETDQDEDM